MFSDPLTSRRIMTHLTDILTDVEREAQKESDPQAFREEALGNLERAIVLLFRISALWQGADIDRARRRQWLTAAGLPLDLSNVPWTQLHIAFMFELIEAMRCEVVSEQTEIT